MVIPVEAQDFASHKTNRIMRKKIIILFLALMALMTACRTQEVPGRRRAPRRCNTCTKWSYIPVKTIEDEA